MKEKMIINEWTGCYPSNWKGVIVCNFLVIYTS